MCPSSVNKVLDVLLDLLLRVEIVDVVFVEALALADFDLLCAQNPSFVLVGSSEIAPLNLCHEIDRHTLHLSDLSFFLLAVLLVDFDDLSEAKITAGGRLLECLAEKPQMCNFALPFGHTAFCNCPVRWYIAEKLRV